MLFVWLIVQSTLGIVWFKDEESVFMFLLNSSTFLEVISMLDVVLSSFWLLNELLNLFVIFSMF